MPLMDTMARHLTVWRAAWQADTTRPLAPAPSGRAVEFLPAVLEIQDAPPSPVGRAIVWTIMAVFTAAVTWAGVGWIDIVAVAPGKITPSGYSKVIQPYETGVVAAIHVQDGQVVKQGEVLIELDQTLHRADWDRATNEQGAALAEAARLRALIDGQAEFEPPIGSAPDSVTLQQRLLREQLAEYQARRDAALHLIDQRRAARAATRENIRRLEATVPLEAERADTYKQLFEHEAAARMDYLQAEEQRIVVPQDHPVEVVAQVENKDIGFVKEGQPVEVKIETFLFTLYGTISGRVLSVSDDAVPLDKEKEKGGLVYATRVGLDRSTIQVEGKPAHLSPGMAVTVKIKTGQRRIIEYLLSPLLKSVKESLRER